MFGAFLGAKSKKVVLDCFYIHLIGHSIFLNFEFLLCLKVVVVWVKPFFSAVGDRI